MRIKCEFLTRSIQKFSVKPFSKGLWGVGQSPTLGAKRRYLRRSRRLKKPRSILFSIRAHSPSQSIFGAKRAKMRGNEQSVLTPPRSVQKFSVKPFSKGLWGVGQSPTLGAKRRYSRRSRRLKNPRSILFSIRTHSPSQSIFGAKRAKNARERAKPVHPAVKQKSIKKRRLYRDCEETSRDTAAFCLDTTLLNRQVHPIKAVSLNVFSARLTAPYCARNQFTASAVPRDTSRKTFGHRARFKIFSTFPIMRKSFSAHTYPTLFYNISVYLSSVFGKFWLILSKNQALS